MQEFPCWKESSNRVIFGKCRLSSAEKSDILGPPRALIFLFLAFQGMSDGRAPFVVPVRCRYS